MKQQTIINDSQSVMQVLGCLVQDLLLFAKPDYHLDINDFSEQFHRIVYGALENLALQGLQKVTCTDIDQYLSQYPSQYSVYSKNKGNEYISKIADIAHIENFDYYFKHLKKTALLNTLSQKNFDISSFYNESLTDPTEIATLHQYFDSLSLEDIINYYEQDLVDFKCQYCATGDIVEEQAGEGILNYIDELKEVPEMGLSLVSPKMTTMYRGQRLGKLYIETSPQGVGKSRRQAAESAHLAISEYYDINKKKWVKTQYNESVLQISTELDLKEVQTMWLAYVSAVPEDHILDGKYEAGEEDRVRYAGKLIQKAHLYFVSVSNYSIDDILNLISRYHQQFKVDYIYYDYLSTTLKILSEITGKSKISNMREDQVILTFTTKLKDLAKKLNIFIWTATQVSGDWQNAKNPDQQLIRGAKSTADKNDIGSIMLPVRESDKTIIDSWKARNKIFANDPTHVIFVYKVRRGHYNNLRLYVYFDRSTCRLYDCFVTDNDGNIKDVDDTTIDIILDETKKDFVF